MFHVKHVPIYTCNCQLKSLMKTRKKPTLFGVILHFATETSYANPHQYPTGLRTMVLINGVSVVEDSVHTGALPGRVLRRNAAGTVL